MRKCYSKEGNAFFNGLEELATPAYPIERGIQIPAIKAGKYLACKFPFMLMRPGDSFLLRKDRHDNLSTVRSEAINTARKLRMRVTTREVPGGVRVWLVSPRTTAVVLEK